MDILLGLHIFFFSFPAGSTYCNLLKHMEIDKTKPNTPAHIDQNCFQWKVMHAYTWLENTCCPTGKIFWLPKHCSVFSNNQVRYATTWITFWHHQWHSNTITSTWSTWVAHASLSPSVNFPGALYDLFVRLTLHMQTEQCCEILTFFPDNWCYSVNQKLSLKPSVAHCHVEH